MIKFIVYFLIVAFIFLYNYILAGESSMLMLYTFILTPILSMLFTYPAKSRLEFFFQIPNKELEKGGIINATLTIKNKSIFPAPFIRISFIEALNLSISQPNNISVFLGPMQKKSINVEYKAKYRGVAKVGIKDIVLKDYIGFLKFSLLKDLKEKRNIGEVMVTPKLVHIKPNNKIFKNSGNANEDAESISNNILTWSGEPGYEFRQYMPGDSLQKIHWKLSAKNDTLMVRKDEGSAMAKKLLIIDPYINSGKKVKKQKRHLLKSEEDENQNVDEVLMIEEKILEAALAIANVNVTFGREIDIWLLEEDKWHRHIITDTRSISSLKYKLAQFEFKRSLESKTLNRVPTVDVIVQSGEKQNLKIGDVFIFTGTEDNLLANEINKFLNYGTSVNVVMVESFKDNESRKKDILYSNIMLENLWVVDIKEDLNKIFL